MPARVRFVLAVILAASVVTPAVAAAPQGDLDAAPRISLDEFKKLSAAGTIVVLDVRDEGSYAVGHIPGATLADSADMTKVIATLRGEKRPIVTYCA